MSPIIEALSGIQALGYSKQDIADFLTDILGKKVYQSRVYAWLKPGEMPRYETGDAIIKLHKTLTRQHQRALDDRKAV